MRVLCKLKCINLISAPPKVIIKGKVNGLPTALDNHFFSRSIPLHEKGTDSKYQPFFRYTPLYEKIGYANLSAHVGATPSAPKGERTPLELIAFGLHPSSSLEEVRGVGAEPPQRTRTANSLVKR